MKTMAIHKVNGADMSQGIRKIPQWYVHIKWNGKPPNCFVIWVAKGFATDTKIQYLWELKDTKKAVSDAIPVEFSLNGMDYFVHAAKCN